ncbi:hypothetical protein PPL_06735 [Heterostelium album PN500]|uniref:Clu domain-containing protein n=1 Tax=Heterostelium pallidum (strain ATCC 26659 / Pp 5 / PN500) TaxID=670386 RepID=D3BFK1_HETP5|nr:hypothetical protein PPL_06735 [Heterostelium album PN500]EFA79915.1 hypothetical protein PPL_06735 [Heterostelium album PN500]|eukprot:XP_020432036.1 hypothetical protein PPL_06735 [Heterostelium album PN500]
MFQDKPQENIWYYLKRQCVDSSSSKSIRDSLTSSFSIFSGVSTFDGDNTNTGSYLATSVDMTATSTSEVPGSYVSVYGGSVQENTNTNGSIYSSVYGASSNTKISSLYTSNTLTADSYVKDSFWRDGGSTNTASIYSIPSSAAALSSSQFVSNNNNNNNNSNNTTSVSGYIDTFSDVPTPPQQNGSGGMTSSGMTSSGMTSSGSNLTSGLSTSSGSNTNGSSVYGGSPYDLTFRDSRKNQSGADQAAAVQSYLATTPSATAQQQQNNLQNNPELQKLTSQIHDQGITTKSTLPWNESFQELLDRPVNSHEEERVRNLNISHFSQILANTAKKYVKALVQEVHIAPELKSIKPFEAGGFAGGEKFRIDNMFIKFALNPHQIYERNNPVSYFANKAAGHELKSINALVSCGVPNLHFPLMCLLNYRGFRLIVISELPINSNTLVFGSSNAGETIKENDTVFKMMVKIGEILNLKTHLVEERGKINSAKFTIPLAIDIEGHFGHDGRYYVVDTARLFPPETPILGITGGHLYRLFRPEFVKRYETQLCADAFAAFNVVDQEPLNDEAMKANNYLIQEYIPMFLKNFVHSELKKLDIKALLHKKGVNLRYLGLILQQLTQFADIDDLNRYRLQGLITVEMLARLMRFILFSEMRSINSPDDRPHLEIRFGNDDIGTANFKEKLAMCNIKQKKYKEASENLEIVLAIKKKIFQNESIEVADTYDNLAWSLQSQGEYEKSLSYYNQALKIKLEKGGNSMSVAKTLNNLGHLLLSNNELDKSLEIFKNVQDIFVKQYGTDHSDVAIALDNIALVYAKKKNYPMAEKYFNDTITIRIKQFGEDSRYVALTKDHLAQLYVSWGTKSKYAEADRLFQECIRVSEKFPDQYLKGFLRYNYSKLFKKKKDKAKESEYLNMALQIFEINNINTDLTPKIRSRLEQLKKTGFTKFKEWFVAPSIPVKRANNDHIQISQHISGHMEMSSRTNNNSTNASIPDEWQAILQEAGITEDISNDPTFALTVQALIVEEMKNKNEDGKQKIFNDALKMLGDPITQFNSIRSRQTQDACKSGSWSSSQYANAFAKEKETEKNTSAPTLNIEKNSTVKGVGVSHQIAGLLQNVNKDIKKSTSDVKRAVGISTKKEKKKSSSSPSSSPTLSRKEPPGGSAAPPPLPDSVIPQLFPQKSPSDISPIPSPLMQSKRSSITKLSSSLSSSSSSNASNLSDSLNSMSMSESASRSTHAPPPDMEMMRFASNSLDSLESAEMDLPPTPPPRLTVSASLSPTPKSPPAPLATSLPSPPPPPPAIIPPPAPVTIPITQPQQSYLLPKPLPTIPTPNQQQYYPTHQAYPQQYPTGLQKPSVFGGYYPSTTSSNASTTTPLPQAPPRPIAPLYPSTSQLYPTTYQVQGYSAPRVQPQQSQQPQQQQQPIPSYQLQPTTPQRVGSAAYHTSAYPAPSYAFGAGTNVPRPNYQMPTQPSYLYQPPQQYNQQYPTNYHYQPVQPHNPQYQYQPVRYQTPTSPLPQQPQQQQQQQPVQLPPQQKPLPAIVQPSKSVQQQQQPIPVQLPPQQYPLPAINQPLQPQYQTNLPLQTQFPSYQLYPSQQYTPPPAPFTMSQLYPHLSQSNLSSAYQAPLQETKPSREFDMFDICDDADDDDDAEDEFSPTQSNSPQQQTGVYSPTDKDVNSKVSWPSIQQLRTSDKDRIIGLLKEKLQERKQAL